MRPMFHNETFCFVMQCIGWGTTCMIVSASVSFCVGFVAMRLATKAMNQKQTKKGETP